MARDIFGNIRVTKEDLYTKKGAKCDNVKQMAKINAIHILFKMR